MVAGCQTDIQKDKIQILPFRRQESAVFTSTDLPILSAHRILKCLAASAHEEKLRIENTSSTIEVEDSNSGWFQDWT